MIEAVKIENYKSIEKLKLELGRVTVFVGENGSGKSNILEAIALASAAANNKLDNEFLVSRGIRVSNPQFMRSAFDKEKTIETIKINIFSDQEEFFYVLQNDNQPYSHWSNNNREKIEFLQKLKQAIYTLILSDEEAKKNIDITLLRYFQELQLKDEKELFNQNQNSFNINNSEAMLILVSA